MNEITHDILKSVIKSFENDCKLRFHIKPISSGVFDKAKEIIVKYGGKKSLRTLDAIQLSVFLNIRDRNAVFVSADELLLECAKDENLKVLKASQ